MNDPGPNVPVAGAAAANRVSGADAGSGNGAPGPVGPAPGAVASQPVLLTLENVIDILGAQGNDVVVIGSLKKPRNADGTLRITPGGGMLTFLSRGDKADAGRLARALAASVEGVQS